MKPLFMWAGGKTRLLKKYQESNGLPAKFDSYVEPFLGGGAMFVWAYTTRIQMLLLYLNDSNDSVMNIYRAIASESMMYKE